MPFCPKHGLRFHPSSGNFVFYNGRMSPERLQATLRNVLFETGFFERYIYGSPHKAERHRFCFETSEDALTWNVCSAFARSGLLDAFATFLAGRPVTQVQLYLWGIPVNLTAPAAGYFDPLLAARSVFEVDVDGFHTEPDIILYAPKQILVVCEAKFTSGNPLARDVPVEEGEKPVSKAGSIETYTTAALPWRTVASRIPGDPFYTQLYRELVFTVHMAEQLGVEWQFANLFSRTQWTARGVGPEYQDPTPAVCSWLEPEHQGRFRAVTWENLYSALVEPAARLSALGGYIFNKSAGMRRAFDV